MHKTLKCHTVQTQMASNWFPSTTCLSRLLSWFVFTCTLRLYHGFKKRVECTLGAPVFQNKHHLFTTGEIFPRCQQKPRWGFVCLGPSSLSPVKTRWPFNKTVISSYCCTNVCACVCLCSLICLSYGRAAVHWYDYKGLARCAGQLSVIRRFHLFVWVIRRSVLS